MRVYLHADTSYEKPVRYVLDLIARHMHESWVWVDRSGDADVIFDHGHADSIPLAHWFYETLVSKAPQLHHTSVFKNKPVIEDESGHPDWIATIFYLVNALQEFDPEPDQCDRFGRFRYEASCQYRFGNIEENLVQRYLEQLLEQWKLKCKPIPSRIFVSHDVDDLYGSFLQDGWWAFKRGRVDVLLRLLFNEALRKPHWRNLDRLVQVNDAHDVKSTFFWLVHKGIGEQGIKNADYRFSNECSLRQTIEAQGSINALHKSCSPDTYREELALGSDLKPFNRHHFLRFLPHRDWKAMDEQGILLDATLGFAEHYGFRNSYGMPFRPYDVKNRAQLGLVEVPLQLMDRTFSHYMHVPQDRIADTIVDFCEKHRYNSVLSLLWHNTFLTNYKFKGYLEVYKKVLGYVKESGMETVLPEDML